MMNALTPTLPTLGLPAAAPLGLLRHLVRAVRRFRHDGIGELDDHLRRDVGLPRREARRADERLFDLP